ncbi:MAG TPA: ester cyclase [Gemmataceae bacterium]|jgi:steroid delta-isomerase-like uncharacterized protein|nr:ester cyclase [Gemmataceae bacterium]
MNELPAELRARRDAVVRAHVDAENTANLDGTVASFHHPQYDVVPMGAVFDGAAAVQDLIGGLIRGFPDFHFDPTIVHHAEKAVIVEGRMTGTHRAEWAGISPKGKKLDMRLACVFNFDGDRLINETVYFDFATLQRQLG